MGETNLKHIGTICNESDCDGKQLKERCFNEICNREDLSSIVKGLEERFGENYIGYQVTNGELYAQIYVQENKYPEEGTHMISDRGIL